MFKDKIACSLMTGECWTVTREAQLLGLFLMCVGIVVFALMVWYFLMKGVQMMEPGDKLSCGCEFRGSNEAGTIFFWDFCKSCKEAGKNEN